MFAATSALAQTQGWLLSPVLQMSPRWDCPDLVFPQKRRDGERGREGEREERKEGSGQGGEKDRGGRWGLRRERNKKERKR